MQNKIQIEDFQDLKKAFSSPIGEKALKILNRLFYSTISYKAGDSHGTAFNEGHRDVMQFINNCVAFDSEHQDSTKEKKT